jgi:hypothetical protein
VRMGIQSPAYFVSFKLRGGLGSGYLLRDRWKTD